MKSTEANSTRLPIVAAVIYLGALFLALVADPFGGPEKLPRKSKNDAPFSEIIGDNEGFGWAAAGGADFDGDGVFDLLVSSPMGNQESRYHGQGHILSPTKRTAIHLPITSPWPWHSNIASVSLLSDLNQDGSPEIAFGFHGLTNNVRRSCVQVVSGINGQDLFTLANKNRGEQFGRSICSIGDIDGDKIDDLAIGAPGSSKNNRPGMVYLYSGKNGRTIGNIMPSNRAGNRFGYSLAYIGDTNNDGKGELMVGAPGTSSNGYRSGTVFVYTPATGELIRQHNGGMDNDHLGTAVAALEDHDGDGVNDYAFTSCSDLRESTVRVISGANGQEIFAAESAAKGDQFGFSLCLAGDINGDQVRDLVVGAPFAAHGEIPGVGYVRFISGRDGSLLKHIRGTEENEYFGFNVAPAGDQNRDEKADVFVTSPMSDGRKGRVSIFGIGQAQER
ncbi:MAG: hypothetical protein ACI97A_003049 [Planctomycetota bacterium]|jgi:hypothetical protein